MRRSRSCCSCRACIRQRRRTCFSRFCCSLADYGFRRNRRLRLERRSVAEVSHSVSIRVELSGIRFPRAVVFDIGDLVAVGVFRYRGRRGGRGRRGHDGGRLRGFRCRRNRGRCRSRCRRGRDCRFGHRAYGRFGAAKRLRDDRCSGSRRVSASGKTAASRFVGVSHFHPLANLFRALVPKRIHALGDFQS